MACDYVACPKCGSSMVRINNAWFCRACGYVAPSAPKKEAAGPRAPGKGGAALKSLAFDFGEARVVFRYGPGYAVLENGADEYVILEREALEERGAPESALPAMVYVLARNSIARLAGGAKYVVLPSIVRESPAPPKEFFRNLRPCGSLNVRDFCDAEGLKKYRERFVSELRKLLPGCSAVDRLGEGDWALLYAGGVSPGFIADATKQYMESMKGVARLSVDDAFADVVAGILGILGPEEIKVFCADRITFPATPQLITAELGEGAVAIDASKGRILYSF